MNVTKRRQLSTDVDNPTSAPEELIAIAERIAECERSGSAANYCRTIEWANYALNRYDRGFLAGYLTARRASRS